MTVLARFAMSTNVLPNTITKLALLQHYSGPLFTIHCETITPFYKLRWSSPTSHRVQSSSFSTAIPASTTFQNRLKDIVAVITGASSGMGRATALAFAAEGTRLVVCADLCAHAKEVGDPTQEVIRRRYGNEKALFVKTDVGVSEDVRARLAQGVEYGGGKLDV